MGLAGFASGHSEHRGGSVHARGLVAFPRHLEGKCPFSARDVKDSIGGQAKRAEDARQQLGNSRAELVVSVLRVDLREIGAVKRRHPPTRSRIYEVSWVFPTAAVSSSVDRERVI